MSQLLPLVSYRVLLRLVLWTAFLLAVLPVGPSLGAQLLVTPFAPQSNLVGETIQIGVGLTATGPEGPGEVSIRLDWGSERESPYWLGAMTLEALPSVLNPAVSVVTGSDCLAAVGDVAGSCSVTLTFAEPTQDGVNALAEFDFTYRWILAPGYERCFSIETDPTCVGAGQRVAMRIEGTLFDGTTNNVFLDFGTFGQPGVRAIPEPSAAILSMMGLAMLAKTRDPRGRRADS